MTFAEKASEFSSEITVRRSDSKDAVDGKSIMQILMLAGTMGTVLVISAVGEDAGPALKSLKALVDAGFEEEE